MAHGADKTRKAAFQALAIWLLVVASSAEAAQGTFSQSVPMTPGQFFQQVKEVSLEVKSDLALAQVVPLAEQQRVIATALAGDGIAVHSGAPITLRVTVDYPISTIKTTSEGQEQSSQSVRGVFVDAQFFVTAAALRHGELHFVRAAVADSGVTGYRFADDNEVRKALFGDHTAGSVRDHFLKSVAEALNAFKSMPAALAQSDAWVVSSWSQKQKDALDADFVKAMTAKGISEAVDKSPYEGLASTPHLELVPQTGQYCVVDPAWRRDWSAAFERLHWTGAENPPSLTLNHFYSCNYVGGPAPHYYALLDQITLTEANLVYAFNGRLVRSPGAIGGQHHETIALDNDASDRTDERMGSFLSHNVTDFLTDLALGNNGSGLGAGVVSSTSPSVSVPVVRNRSARMIFGDAVESKGDQWYLADGTAVPAQLIASKSGLPILEPKQQYSVLRAPVDGYIKEIIDTLRDTHSCTVNLFHGMVSDFALDIDDRGVVTGMRSVSLPGSSKNLQLQGAALANLDLAHARIFNNGDCVVVSLQCRNAAQCVRSVSQSSASPTGLNDGADVIFGFYVNSADQGNRVLNALRALAPFYPDGAGEIQ